MKQRKQKGERRGRRKSKEFMDAATDAYVRHLALEKWREITDLQESSGMSAEEAIREAGDFRERGLYCSIWNRQWESRMIPGLSAGSLFEHIETAVREALDEEVEMRKGRGDVPIEDTPSYKSFIDHALERLFSEAAGTIEEL
ncbi:MAG TPA: hypothetical protein VE131_09970 [Terriglobales bacterium]|jgi:hypothetical protein|nr:hypothetical protein [Terriglobales bacterium]